MDEKQREEIKQESRKLLEKFSKQLDTVKSPNNEEWNVIRDLDRREEKEGKACNETFRKMMLENAPVHDEESIIAEKKSW
jgi:predicted Asp-tRNA(Asn)/Glu-tRNA(Gln) amidotransferase subunit C